MATWRDEARDAYTSVRASVRAVDELLHGMAEDIARAINAAIIRVGPLQASDRRLLMRLIDPIIQRYFGTSRRTAAQSPLYRLIEQRAAATGIGSVQRGWDELDAYMRATDPDRWARITAHLATAPLDQRDGLMLTYRMLYGPHIDQQRLLNSRLLDPMRRWVDPNGYRLSDRVWMGSKRIRQGIDRRIVDGIRRGESPEVIARAIRQYVDPAYAPIKYQKNGRIIRTAAGRQQRSAAEIARTLVRTETSRVHGESTKFRADGTPGVIGVRWRLSAQHPGKDPCDQNATNDDYGLGPGTYPVDQVPMHPNHPRCLCVLVPAHESREETRRKIVEKYRKIALGDLA